MRSVDAQRTYQTGCKSGKANESGLVILAFGQPWLKNGAFGSLLLDGKSTFVTTDEIQGAVKGFARGYADCSPANGYMRIAVGTSNYGPYILRDHGVRWARLINALNDWLNTDTAINKKIDIAGGNDIELAWNTPTASRDWVDGYASEAKYVYYNFGACDGCPYAKYPNATLPRGWTMEGVWYVSFGSKFAEVVPEIYLTSGVNADQWQRVALYSMVSHNRPMTIAGVLSQWQACQTNGPCRGTDNTPASAQKQMQDALNSDNRTARPLRWSSDITWRELDTLSDMQNGTAQRITSDLKPRSLSGEPIYVGDVQAPFSTQFFKVTNRVVLPLKDRLNNQDAQIVIYAGADAQDAKQGMLFVALETADDSQRLDIVRYAGTGALRIDRVNSATVRLVSTLSPTTERIYNLSAVLQNANVQ